MSGEIEKEDVRKGQNKNGTYQVPYSSPNPITRIYEKNHIFTSRCSLHTLNIEQKKRMRIEILTECENTN